MNFFLLTLRLVAAGILAQTLFFKFSAAKESVYIFSTLGVEPWGRLVAACSELVASILLLVPATQALGGLMAAGIMGGALASHIFILGIVVEDDGGLLFSLAVVVLACSVAVAYLRRDQLIGMMKAVRPLPA